MPARGGVATRLSTIYRLLGTRAADAPSGVSLEGAALRARRPRPQ